MEKKAIFMGAKVASWQDVRHDCHRNRILISTPCRWRFRAFAKIVKILWHIIGISVNRRRSAVPYSGRVPFLNRRHCASKSLGYIVYPRVCQSTKKPRTDAGLFCARGGRRGEDPPEDLGLRGDQFTEKASRPAGHYIQQRFVAEG
jgi:hypothetical protein